METEEKKEIRQIKAKRNPIQTVCVPGSKSITNRALLLAVMGSGKSTLRGCLFSEDSRHFLQCVQDLGFETRVDEAAATIEVTGLGGCLPVRKGSVYVGSAGTAARFLAAYLACNQGEFLMDASEQMRRRPMEPLIEALRSVGAEIECTQNPGHFPLVVKGHGILTDHVTVDIDQSSQFLSALLIAAPLAERGLTIDVSGSHGMAYIDMTVKMMEQFGVSVSRVGKKRFVVFGGQGYRALDYPVEPDVSAACYFWALAAIHGISVTVPGIHAGTSQNGSLQGDVAFASLLARMGCQVTEEAQGVRVTGPADGVLKGVSVDMRSFSDQAITLAAIAPFADSPVEMTGIGHIRRQESDRLSAMAKNLRAMGIQVEEREDSIRIEPGLPKAAVIETCEDHRLAMGFALTGTRAEGIVIQNPGCCKKTFEQYFDVLEQVTKAIEGR
ncbi:MAG: 3-phosphoshikimate 1-carboxyvinyltransferase [Lachnospiraceae bacterium]|nr:3-phosphoshikimate 1-carboxyvinyltransferase [Lachnospiraceae bacterium]